jgi:hypothetical protein
MPICISIEMQQSVVGKEMLVNHKWNDEMVKWNNGNEYVVNIVNIPPPPPPPPPPTEWLHALMQLSVGHGRKESMVRKFSKIFKSAYKELCD